ncbi:hypothetical protein JCM1393_09830 [Clostridium carnis]
MPYINFKEERVVAKDQLNKRIKNNKKLYDSIKKSKKISKAYSPDSEYSYKNLDNKIFGDKELKAEEDFKEVSNKDIICTTFKECKFHNIKFKDCRFIGCYFINCDFNGGGATFDNCTFIKADSEKLPSLNRKDNLSCQFENCNLYINFINSTLSYSIFKECNIKNSNFEINDMTSVIIIDSKINMVILSDVDLSGAKIVNTYIEDLEFRDKYKTKMDEKTFIDTIKVETKTKEEYEGLYMVYETIANKFKENNLSNNFGEYYYLAQTMKNKVLKPIPKVFSFLNWGICGYGERPAYAIYSSIVIIVIFSILYLFMGMDIDGELINLGILINNFEFFKFMSYCNEALNLSVGMFAGVGFNKAMPIPLTYMVSNIEMLVGIVMMGIGIGSLTKKLIR